MKGVTLAYSLTNETHTEITMTLTFETVDIENQRWIRFTFEDGTKWFIHPDGTIADSYWKELADMTYESLLDFIESNL
jgi:hypothetical protein